MNGSKHKQQSSRTQQGNGSGVLLQAKHFGPLMVLCMLVLLQSTAWSQSSSKRNELLHWSAHRAVGYGFYVAGRVPRTFYWRSDLTLQGTVHQGDGTPVVFDVEIEKIKSVDDGSAFVDIYRAFTQSVQSPPYGAAIGYRFKNSIFGVAGRFLHYKQFMVAGQQNHINGTVGNVTYANHYGQAPFLLKYENTDGHNIISVGVEASVNFWKSPNRKHALGAFGMLGPALGVTRTDAIVRTPDGTILSRNNDFKVSGGGLIFELGISSTHFAYLTFFAETNVSVIRNSDMLIMDDGQNRLRGSQTIGALGCSFGFALSIPQKGG